MSKIIVSPELSVTIKRFRVENSIQAKELARYVEKSPSYITKLETGEIKKIDSELLNKILEYVIKDKTEKNEFIEKIYSSLEHKYSAEELEKIIWFLNYDTVFRKIPVPKSLIDYILSKMQKNDINYSVLLKRINANEALPKELLTDNTIEHNIWHPYNNGKHQYIKMLLTEAELTDILEQRVNVSSYVFILCIVLNILKIEKFGNSLDISFDENQKLMDNAKELLNKYKFYSITEKKRLLSNAETLEEMSDLLSSFDNENAEIVSSILSKLKTASELDIETTNIRLSDFEKNLNWDVWFMLRLISINFTKLNNMSTTLKKQLLSEIEKTVNKYEALTDEQKTIETY